MKEQLTHYVDLLFAAAPDAWDIKQEILQNTLDRYDDLIEQGKNPQAAYQLAISGIGDINEILGGTAVTDPAPAAASGETPEEKKKSKLGTAAAVALYIMCPLPLFILGNEIGLCLLLVMVAAATALLMIYGKEPPKSTAAAVSPQVRARNSICSAVRWIGVAVYIVLSFVTGAWHITWIIFLIVACVNGLIKACFDLKEAN